MRTMLLLLLIAASAGAWATDIRSSPERTAQEYIEHRISGELEPIYTLLVSWDRAAVPRAGFPDNAPPHARLWRLGLPDARLDSVRLRGESASTALAVAYMTVPDYEQALGQSYRDALARGTIEEDEVRRITKDAPRVARVDSVPLVREDGQWRVTFQLDGHARAETLWPAVANADRIETRAAAARVFLALADSLVAFDGARTDRARHYLHAAALRDSLHIDLRLEGHAFSTLLTGEVRNQSHTPIRGLELAIVTTKGERIPFRIGAIPAGYTNRVMKLQRATGAVQEVAVMDIEFD